MKNWLSDNAFPLMVGGLLILSVWMWIDAVQSIAGKVGWDAALELAGWLFAASFIGVLVQPK